MQNKWGTLFEKWTVFLRLARVQMHNSTEYTNVRHLCTLIEKQSSLAHSHHGTQNIGKWQRNELDKNQAKSTSQKFTRLQSKNNVQNILSHSWRSIHNQYKSWFWLLTSCICHTRLCSITFGVHITERRRPLTLLL